MAAELDPILGQRLLHAPVAVAGVDGVVAVEVDPAGARFPRQPRYLHGRIAGADVQAAAGGAQLLVELAQAREQVGVAVRARVPSRVEAALEAEDGHDPGRLAGGGQRRVVMHPQIAPEPGDRDFVVVP